MSTIAKAVSRYTAVRYLNILNKNARGFKNTQKMLIHNSSYLNVKGLEIKMPSLSPTMSEGKIVKWLKKEGDQLSPGDVLCDIETDKAVMSMEIDEEGVLAKILVPENSKTMSVGSLIALMVEVGEDWKEVELPSETTSPAETTPVSEKSQSSDQPVSGPSGIPVKMPSLSPTMTAGTILKWLKKEGDPLAAGDILCDIQTDKAVISYETDEDGILAKILIPEDTKDIKVGTLIALIVGEGEDWKNVVVPQTSAKTDSKVESKSDSATTDTSPTSASSESPGKLYGPAVRSLLSVYQLNSEAINATGRNNVLLKEDVLKYIEENKLQKKPPKPVSMPSASPQTPQPVSKPSAAAPPVVPKPLVSEPVPDHYKQGFGRRSRERFVDIEISSIRSVIAKRLTQSKQGTPHAYGRVDCQVDELVRIRKEMINKGMKASLNDYIVKGVALALEACPRVNVVLANNEYRHSPTIDIAVAVATPTGLITPIIPDVAKKTVFDISDTLKEMVPRARAGKLKPNEFQGGSFTVSNLGMFGIKHFTAIINPPQCAILAVGAAIDRFGTDLKTHHDMSFTLSFDRRALQEDEVAEFLEKLKYYIENPKQLVAPNVSARRALRL